MLMLKVFLKTLKGCLGTIYVAIAGKPAHNNASVAEWSKATDLSPVIFGCVGSNPT